MITDITERRRSEAALLDLQTRLQLVFDNMPVGLNLRRAQGSREDILRNPAHIRITGVSEEEGLIEGIYTQRTLPEDRFATAGHHGGLEAGRG